MGIGRGCYNGFIMSDLKELLEKINFKNTDWSCFNWETLGIDFKNFHDLDLEGLSSKGVGKLKGLYGMWMIYGKNTGGKRESTGGYGRDTRDSRIPPFRIPAYEKTERQWGDNPRGYKASAAWQTASLLRDLIRLFTPTLSRSEYRLKAQMDDAARSMVANIEEGYSRPSTLEYIQYMGFSHASMEELDGDIERCLTDGFLKSKPGIYGRGTGEYGRKRGRDGKNIGNYGRGTGVIPTPSRKFPYPPARSRRNPGKYGKLREKLREYTGKEITANDLSYEIFKELTNKTDFLMRRTVEGLRAKIIKDASQDL